MNTMVFKLYKKMHKVSQRMNLSVFRKKIIRLLTRRNVNSTFFNFLLTSVSECFYIRFLIILNNA